jgi:hypothetical protein
MSHIFGGITICNILDEHIWEELRGHTGLPVPAIVLSPSPVWLVSTVAPTVAANASAKHFACLFKPCDVKVQQQPTVPEPPQHN